MALERFFVIDPLGLNFFHRDAALAVAEMDARIKRMREQLYHLLPYDPIGDDLKSVIPPDVPIVQEGGETKLKLSFNMQDYRPEEIKVKMLGNNVLQVRAEHVEKSDAGESKKLYIRQYTLPEGVNVDGMRPTLTKDGVLTIEAPAPTLTATERLIPIESKQD